MTQDGRKGQRGLFLARERYRQRRLRDGARMLPIIGFILWVLPMLWVRDEGDPGGLAGTVVYVFVVWMVLIGVAFVVARRIDTTDDVEPSPAQEGSD
ncbi:hypothetical protein AN189_03660 [Loktanella sp. 3ANDIMAR09]|uniref:hypothetical protein n=1 Tax=Loktanella sp. 3ANDIMAR09 TaxID=1225657 RepID=UPI0006FB6E50|nr:hypothetical protein [Loktanella sp. 3ANDIMAR09]KQI69510.1 hypothetical protein AN189_03660 [Loktanella sp. 3ANDIMAR09]